MFVVKLSYFDDGSIYFLKQICPPSTKENISQDELQKTIDTLYKEYRKQFPMNCNFEFSTFLETKGWKSVEVKEVTFG